MVAITGAELQEWVEFTSRKWRALLSSHPEVLAFPCDIRETQSVAQFLQHVVAVELRYAERLNGLEETPYESIPFDSVDAIYATHDKAMDLLRPLSGRDDFFWEEELEFKTRSAGVAQLATLARTHGVAPEWGMDYLWMKMRR